MRFSVRDLLWLMAVVALSATMYADRVRAQRQAQKWAAEKEKLQQESAVAQAVLKARVDGLREQNALLQHQLVIRLERERQRDVADAEQTRSAAFHSRPRPASSPATSVPDEAEN
jgi:hypothetical protein